MLVADHVLAEAAWKKFVCRMRSKRTMNCTPAMNGVAATTSSEVEVRPDEQRQAPVHPRRMVTIVTKKRRAVAIDEAPANCTPKLKNDWPNGASVESGA